MSNIDKQALRQTAEKAQEHGVFNMDIHSQTVLALLDELEAAEKRIAELEAQEIQPVGMQLITEAIGAHGYIVGCLQQNRPDLALQESLKWMQAFGQAAQIAAGTAKGE